MEAAQPSPASRLHLGRDLMLYTLFRLAMVVALAGPLVRSSYRAGRLWAQAMQRKGRDIPAHLQHLADAAAQPATQEAASLI